MGRIKKKGTSGAAKNYITRSKAVRKLQISLPDFRRLCIFKGIYPREPRNKRKVSKGSTSATTFYYTKDISYLLHEPLLNKFREHKAVAKKIAKALGRGEVGDASRLEKTLVPKLKLDHIIKERYPTFIDALRDLDDALSMLFLFANLPSHQYVPAKTIALCQRLCLEFEHYVIVSHSLRKSFLSIKGIYYQATIQGQDILWLVPYRFVQRTAGDIDFRIMGTFIEFYTTLLGFINFRLYTSVGLVYPPKFNAKSDEEGGELGAFQLEGKGISREDETMTNGDSHPAIASAEAQAEADKVATLAAPEEQEEESSDQVAATEEADNTEAIDTFEPTAQDADVLPQPQASSSERGTMFAPFTFYLSRETPRAPLEFLLKSFGCKRVGWDPILGDGAFTTDESDPAITHQIVDRPSLPTDSLPQVPNVPETESGGAARPKAQWPRSTMPGRTYVQPQWVWDCINQGKLLRPDLYAPGAELPPHLSPWVKPKKGQYDPNLPLEAQEPEGEAEAFEDEEEVDESEIVSSTGPKQELSVLERESSVEAGEGMDVDNSESDSEDDEEDEDEDAVGEWDGIDSEAESDISDGEVARRQHQRELEAEATGVPLEPEAPTTKSKNAEIRKKADKKRKAEQEEKERQKMMLSLRKRKLVERIDHGATKRDKEAEALRMKKRRIEKAKAAANAV